MGLTNFQLEALTRQSVYRRFARPVPTPVCCEFGELRSATVDGIDGDWQTALHMLDGLPTPWRWNENCVVDDGPWRWVES